MNEDAPMPKRARATTNHTSKTTMTVESTNHTSKTTMTEESSTPQPPPLPENRFELELEFLQSLASPAYLHFLATTCDLNELQPFLKYLHQTWTQTDYIRFIQYPHCLYFLKLLIDHPNVVKEWTLPAFRNFCHQQQFLAWQTRHATCYGVGKPTHPEQPPETPAIETKNESVRVETMDTTS